MAITREDWLTHERARAEHTRATRQINEGLLQQAAVASEQLTGHPAWDVYLQRLQVMVEETDAEWKQWLEKVAGAYEDADLRMVQMQVNVLKERAQTLRKCMNLPKEILAHAADTLDKPAQ